MSMELQRKDDRGPSREKTQAVDHKTAFYLLVLGWFTAGQYI